MQTKTQSIKIGWGGRPPQWLLYALTTPLRVEKKSSLEHKKKERGRWKGKATNNTSDKWKTNYIKDIRDLVSTRKDIPIKKSSVTKRKLDTGWGEIDFLKVTKISGLQARALGESAKLKWPWKDLWSWTKKANQHGDDRELSNNDGVKQDKR